MTFTNPDERKSIHEKSTVDSVSSHLDQIQSKVHVHLQVHSCLQHLQKRLKKTAVPTLRFARSLPIVPQNTSVQVVRHQKGGGGGSDDPPDDQGEPAPKVLRGAEDETWIPCLDSAVSDGTLLCIPAWKTGGGRGLVNSTWKVKHFFDPDVQWAQSFRV